MTGKKSKKNIYTHKIDLQLIKIKNCPREGFVKTLENLPYRGYEVEQITDGRKIIVTKPGGKLIFGTIKREDFMVWIYDPVDSGMWLISHKNIFEDLETKAQTDSVATKQIIEALEKVYNGEDPEDILQKTSLINPVGETPEVLLKVYKWIWGQEDINYPNGKGRAMSWEGITKNKNGDWEKTGKGIQDILDRCKN